MESITDIVVGLTNRQIKQLAEQILDEIKAEIDDGHVRSGAARDSFHISYNGAGAAISGGDFATGAAGSFHGGFLSYVVIGSNEKSAYYLDQGNGPGRIYPTNGPYLRFRDSRRAGNTGRGYKMKSVNSYEGIHYIKKVADKHR